jgi:DNA-binding MarR family transcriptional regulator
VPESYQRVREAVRVLARINRVLETSETGLTLPQYRLLSALSDGGQRSARLAARLAIRKPTVTALADGLVAAGYAEREGEPGDRRIVRLRMTAAGEAALARADEMYVARLGPLLAAAPEPGRFIDALLAVGAAVDARAPALVAPATSPARPATDPAHPIGSGR